MLIEFRVENHRSLRDEQALTMEAGRVGEDSDVRSRTVSGISHKLLPIAVIYGANASGKSNVLAAIEFMAGAVDQSQRSWSPDHGVPRDPFAWGPRRSKPSMFEVTILINGVRYRYGFVADDERILEEWLYAWPRRKKQIWFERDGGAFKFGEFLTGENKEVQETTRQNSLFLSAAAQMNHRQLMPIYSWFHAIKALNRLVTLESLEPSKAAEAELIRDLDWLKPGSRPVHSGNNGLGETLKRVLLPILKNADLGIVDLTIDYGLNPDAAPVLLLKHQSKYGDAWLPFEKESSGTHTMWRIATPMLLALETGRVLLIDELESSLHPSLALEIVRLFNDPATNPRNAQLIFTTHDTHLLGPTVGEPILRRDQVWLTEKDDEGATVLYPLTDYKPRKAENIERGYLQGRYGAVPFLGDFSHAAE